jgi:hypothetical protein
VAAKIETLAGSTIAPTVVIEFASMDEAQAISAKNLRGGSKYRSLCTHD